MNPIIDSFLQVFENFKLGILPTEQSNLLSESLSDIVHENLPKAISILKQIDINALTILLNYSNNLEQLSKSIKETLLSNKKVFFFGCGATGRLSISLEVMIKMGLINNNKDNFCGFMSGGDLALIKSIEKFEDYPDYGAKQLEEIGFVDGDLLIAITEGGETPIVIGAVEKACIISKNIHYFLYCNPDDILIKTVERSKKVILNEQIKKISICVGPMALSGSTRMQASTVLLLAVGFAINRLENKLEIKDILTNFIECYNKLNLDFLSNFIEKEVSIYKSNEYLIYITNPEYAVTVLTDTTERSPTFTLNPFENINNNEEKMSLSYLCLKDCDESEIAWYKMLLRKPRTLEWEFCKELTGYKKILGYDISMKNKLIREKKGKQNLFEIEEKHNLLCFKLESIEHYLNLIGLNLFEKNVILKMILNIHSTLVMGKLDRYSSNVMTFVKPSNYKLIDRCIRYIDQILKQKYGKIFEYKEICLALDKNMNIVNLEQSIVLKTVEYLIK